MSKFNKKSEVAKGVYDASWEHYYLKGIWLDFGDEENLTVADAYLRAAQLDKDIDRIEQRGFNLKSMRQEMAQEDLVRQLPVRGLISFYNTALS